MDKVIVVKLGGATLGNHDTTLQDIVSLQRQGWSVVVVHGGGKMITDWLEQRGIATEFIDGERVTDEATLEVVVSVLAGVVNKEIVADIDALGGLAVGISGVDGAFIQARIKDTELGYVGVVEKVNLAPLQALLQSGYVPVVAPLGLYSSEQPGETRGIVNINADVVAGEIAAAIGAEKLIFLTDVVGICDQQGKLMPQLSTAEAEALMAAGTASGGMIPKVKACLKALSGILKACIIIDGRQPHALLNEIEGKESGTTIKK
jgi:acetylglutamate kinase